MINSAKCIQREIKVKGQKLGIVTSFKYLGAVVSDDDSKPDVLSRIAQATAALTKLKPIGRDNNICPGSKVKLMHSLVISIFLYACESWTLTAELEKRTQASEIRCYRRLLNILYKDHVTNQEVYRKIQAAIGEYDKLLILVKKRKLRCFGHVSRSFGLAKLVGCFGFNGPLRQYFSLYRAVSQREGERRERIDESKNVQTTPTRTYCKHNRPLPYCNQNCRTPRHWKFTQHHRTTPGLAKTILQGTVIGKKKEADKRRGGKTISKSGQEWTLPAQLGQLKTGQDGKGL